ncbi:MAG: Maf family protein [Candidatus Cloacimonadota bacterium]|nr:Maf family protein [Candidatus Cloacimonadota bacterium]
MIHNLLKNKKVILASASPRRKEIFKLLGIKALQQSAAIDETIFTNNPRKLVKTHALDKARTVATKYGSECFTIGSDTIVYHQKEILFKPQDRYEAADFLCRLSGDYHYVYTGVAVCYKNKEFTTYDKTKVEFKIITAEEIEEYIKTGEPMDKAGAYGIQGYGSQFIRNLNGCYFNVMGFPINKFYEMLKEIL